MIERRCLKNVIFIQTILSFVLSRKIINIYKDIARKYGNDTIKDFRKYEKRKEESDLFKAGLYFSIKPDKIRKSKIFTTFEKIHRLFLNNFKSEEIKVR